MRSLSYFATLSPFCCLTSSISNRVTCFIVFCASSDGLWFCCRSGYLVESLTNLDTLSVSIDLLLIDQLLLSTRLGNLLLILTSISFYAISIRCYRFYRSNVLRYSLQSLVKNMAFYLSSISDYNFKAEPLIMVSISIMKHFAYIVAWISEVKLLGVLVSSSSKFYVAFVSSKEIISSM